MPSRSGSTGSLKGPTTRVQKPAGCLHVSHVFFFFFFFFIHFRFWALPSHGVKGSLLTWTGEHPREKVGAEIQLLVGRELQGSNDGRARPAFRARFGSWLGT